MNELRQHASLLSIDQTRLPRVSRNLVCYRFATILMEDYRESGLVLRPKAVIFEMRLY